MKLTKVILPFFALSLLFSCQKDDADKRIYGRWKIKEYYLDGVNAPDTIVKYFQGYEYEISPIKDSGSQSYCGCDATIRTYDGGIGGNPEYTNIGPESLSTYAMRTFRTAPPSCDSNSASVTCWGFPTRWNYSFPDASTMEWEWFENPSSPNTHKIIFLRI